MPYQISFETKKVFPKLRRLEQENSEIAQQIYDRLDRLAVEREYLNTNERDRLEAFLVGNILVGYNVSHRRQLIDVVYITELP